MTNFQPLNDDDQLDAFLDGVLSEPPSAEDALRAQSDLQQYINDALTRQFPLGAAPEELVQQVAQALGKPAQTIPLFRRPAAWISGFAAAVLISCVLSFFRSSPNTMTPSFAPTPVAVLYQSAVANGFEPYYECRDDARFTAVFASRQGVSLSLLPMPAGSRMLGLSYPGGLTRTTTAMLCEIDGQPVIVFIDRAEADLDSKFHEEAPDELNVFRVVRDGLVFYEVSPLELPHATQYLSVKPAEQNSLNSPPPAAVSSTRQGIRLAI